MTGEEWLLILKRIMEYCEYDVILLDLGGQMEGIFELLQRCERIYMPVATDRIARAKLSQYEKLLRMMEQQEILEKTKKLQVPQTELGSEWPGYDSAAGMGRDRDVCTPTFVGGGK